MQRLGHIMTHLRLVLRMGQATGTDVVAAHRQGRLSQQDWAKMVRSCQGCTWAAKCPDWLDKADSVVQPPNTCPNHKRFEVLKAQQSKGS
ncbi:MULTISPECIES: DUF6455 family protein [unclassified Ruegeria]|uniref:DUF6455 family protein n=1 Tax=unclassified Ruegeria TaxID=2625375 RepID=UPI00211087F7|nr:MULTISPECIES: DUF6455 family protein [unclassified Ruegeria]